MATAHATERTDRAVSGSRTVTRVMAIACVGMFGLGLVWAAGFVNAETLHNAAHDSRHSLVFPCH